MPAVMNTMCAPSSALRMWSTASSAAALPASGLAPAPRPELPSCSSTSALERLSACESVLAQIELHALHTLADHVFDGVAATAAHPDHLDLCAHVKVVDHLDGHVVPSLFV